MGTFLLSVHNIIFFISLSRVNCFRLVSGWSELFIVN